MSWARGSAKFAARTRGEFGGVARFSER